MKIWSSQCEQYTIRQGFSLQVPVYVCIHSLKKDPSHSALWLRIYIPRWPCYTLKTDRDWKTSYFCLDIQATIGISRNWIALFQGRIQKIQKGVAGTLSSYIDTLYFSENYIKIIKISNKKGCPRSRRPSPKSKKYHNTRCYPSKILYKHFFSISLRHEAFVSPKRNWKKLCWKFWTGNSVRKCDESPTSCLARLENKHAGKICLRGLLIKIALSCHVQETEGIQWIVTRKNMIYHGCEHVTERHGNRLFRNDVNYPRESTNTQKNPSRIIIIINDIHNIVIFEELKKNPEKKGKNVGTCSQDYECECVRDRSQDLRHMWRHITSTRDRGSINAHFYTPSRRDR